ncbi:MAG: hypothetical protein CMP74_00560 [Flavobacteriales bacterium]|nr:hypothetical protein [Flavobacteriales bacterium]|tara:strand:- start:3430 stop:3762 length:333 start_codon:yes stop_codon:yes gene_type:complete
MNQLSIQGKLLKKINPESGVRKDGRGWKKQNFILQTENTFNNEICFQLFGEEKMAILNQIEIGEKIEVFFNLSSREYNGKYYHNIDAWKISKQAINNNSEIDNSEDEVPF